MATHQYDNKGDVPFLIRAYTAVLGLGALIYMLFRLHGEIMEASPAAIVISGCFLLAFMALLGTLSRAFHSLETLPALALAVLAATSGAVGLLPIHAAVSFTLYAVAWLLVSRSNANWAVVSAQVLLPLAIIFALLDALADVLNLHLLYPWYHHAKMSVSLAIATAFVGVSFWMAIFNKRACRDYFAQPDRRINAIGVTILLSTAFGAGLAGFTILAHTIEGVVQNSFALSLRDRTKEFEDTITNTVQNVTLVTQRSALSLLLEKSTHGKVITPADRAYVNSLVYQAIGSLNLTAIALENARGERVLERGSWSRFPELTYKLPSSRDLTILWKDRTLLHARLPVTERGVWVGYVIAEIPLPSIDHLLKDVTGLGETGSMLVCAPLSELMHCFPNRHHGPVVVPRDSHGEPVPVSHALNGHAGMVRTEDIEHHLVLSAYRPIGETGIGMVLKIRMEELYAPVRSRFSAMIVLLLGLTLSGVALFRWQITPIARRLADETRERNRAETELNKLSYVLEQSPVAVAIADAKGHVEYINPTFTRLTGYTGDDALGRTPGSMLQSGRTAPEVYREMWDSLSRGVGWTGEIENRHKNGNLYWVNEMILPIFNHEGEMTHYLAMQQDITDRKAAEARLNFMANHDVLTGLPNRSLFTDRLQQAMIDATRHDRLVGIMFLDLDHFKTINDTLGHSIGDMLLKQVTERLAACVRPGDTISRLGGDEFTIILADVGHVDDLVGVAQKMLNRLSAAFSISEHELFVTASIGITVYPFDDRDPESLVRNADAAMYAAKEQGRNVYQFYTAELNQRASRRLSLETALRHALERDEFRLHYQPQVDITTGGIIGVEALIRWDRADIGLVPPAEFIPLAEESGLIVPIGNWALRNACMQAQTWHVMGFETLRIAVNLSSRQFQDRSLTETIRRILRETGLDPRKLDLEITESVLIRNIDAAIANIEALRRLGISFSLDDFGTGYSSLNYLRRLPLESLKLDRSFLEERDANDSIVALASGIIAMAQALGIKVVAEGVETAEQLELLRERGCDALQGYYFSKPLPAQECTALLREGRSLAVSRRARAGR